MNTHKEPKYKWYYKCEVCGRDNPEGTACNHELAPLKPKEVQFKGWEGTDAVARHGDLPEPTPPSQIEEEPAMAEDEEYRNITPLRDLEQRVTRLEEAINKLTKEDK